MARIASQAKGGFYATPVSEIKNVARGLTVKGTHSNLSILDPCCGEGEALHILSSDLKDEVSRIEKNALITTYGCELEHGRAEEAKQVLDHVIADGFQNMRTEDKFSALWLNPPYDEEEQSERTELRFLRTLTSKSKNVLAKDGLLMFCVPQYILKSCALILSSRFYGVKVYRFTDEEYPVFKQVVVFGYFGRPSESERKMTGKLLRELSDAGSDVLQTTDEIIEGEFEITLIDEEVSLFRAGRMNMDELRKDLASSNVANRAEKMLTIDDVHGSIKNPVLPLKHTHGAIAVASGLLGGNMGNHIITGVTKQITDKTEVKNEQGRVIREEYTKHYQSIVRVFSPQYGVVDLQDTKAK